MTSEGIRDWGQREPEPRIKGLGGRETANEYSKIAEEAFKESDQAFAKQLAHTIPQGFTGYVIDLGSGPGNISIPLARLRPDLKIICFDYDEEMLRLAQTAAEGNGIDANRMQYVQGDMTQMDPNILGTDNFVFSNTAIHELGDSEYPDDLEPLNNTFKGIAAIIGENGGGLIRDLAQPESEQDAEAKRRGAIGNIVLDERGLELFRNSQRAAFLLPDVQAAIDKTTLKGRGTLQQQVYPDDRYWVYQVTPGHSDQHQTTDVHVNTFKEEKPEAEFISTQRQIRTEIIEASIANAKLTEEAFDPLSANAFFRDLPSLITTRNQQEIIQQASELFRTFNTLDLSEYSQEELRAIHRDLAMANTAAIFTGKGVEVIEGAGVALHTIASWTGLPPRNTDYLYAMYPPNTHSRRFTDTMVTVKDRNGDSHKVYEEDIVKLSVGAAFLNQEEFIDSLTKATSGDTTNSELRALLEIAATRYNMVPAIAAVKQQVGIEFFSTELLPLFMRHKVDGKEYFHSGSQNAGQIILDVALGIADPQNPDYREYMNKNIMYASKKTQTALRTVIHNVREGTIIDNVLQQIPGYNFALSDEERNAYLSRYYDVAPKQTREILLALYELYRLVFRFRKPHVQAIEESLKYRPATETSAGDIKMAKNLLNQAEASMEPLRPFYDAHKRATRMQSMYST